MHPVQDNSVSENGIISFDGQGPTLLGRLGGCLQRHNFSTSGLALRLETCASTLATRTAETEPDFLALGGDLRSLYEAASELAQVIDETTARLHSVLTSYHFTGADGLVAATLGAVHAGVRSVDREVNLLTTMMAGLAAMDPQLVRIQRICLFLQSTAVGFAVESTRTTACQQAFGSFVDEIRGLARRIATVEGKVGKELIGARNEETARVKELQLGLGAMRDLAGQLERTSARAAGEVQNGLDRIVSIMNVTRQNSVTLRQFAEEAVYHVQFGDITRQKNEHIVAALREVAGALRRAKRGKQVRVAALAADQTLAIQIGQMDVVCDELASAQQQLAQAFAQIARTAAEFVAPLREHHAAGSNGKAQQIGVLKSDFDQLLELDGRSRDLRRRATETADHAFTTAERLAVQMQEVQSINRDMHLLALNAAIKTAALGSSGATLEVLSMQVHELYREADAAVTEVVTLADRLRKRDAQTADTSGQAPESGAKHRLEEGVQQVRKTFQDFDQLTATALERAGCQSGWLAAATTKLGALQAFAEQLRGLAGELREMRAILTPLCRLQKRDKAVVDAEVENRYTMQGERDVHRRIAAEQAAAQEGGGSLGKASAVEAEIRIATPEALSDEIFVKTPGSAAEMTIPIEREPAEKTLGDNVELF